MSKLNVDSLLKCDTINDGIYRFGYAFDVNINLLDNGTWDTLSNGDKICRLKIISEGAYSINLIFDDFWLSEGSELYIYNNEKNMILGAFTQDISNNDYNKFSTDLIKGDIIILEYFEKSFSSESRINIDKIIHGYKNMFNNKSMDCYIDINCPEGFNWCIEKRAVSMVLIDNNTGQCSGCLINNIRNDLTPYYLTANHCLIGDPHTFLYKFRYWNETCNQGDAITNWITISGSNLKANYDVSDFALLELNVPPIFPFGAIFYAGWNREMNPPISTIGIHHPEGKPMKIHFDYNNAITNQNVINWDDGSISPINTHWETIIDYGAMYHGSSGSPAFDGNHRIIGQLHGGSLSCVEQIAYYGRFDVSWEGGGTPQTRLRDWLDPDNTGTTSIGSTSPPIYLFNKTLIGFHKFAAIESINIEGNISTYNLPICSSSDIPFTAEQGSDVIIKAKEINIYPETDFKAGSNVTLIATNDINCYDNIIPGDFLFCKINNNQKSNIQYSFSDINYLNSLQYKDNKNINYVKENIVIYPNPTSGNFNIEFINQNEKYSTINIYDLTGKIIYKKTNISQDIINIDISKYNNGIYFIKIINQNNTYFKKLIKQ
ncbi:MAG TPA: T9SS type A sorting domain-containing protein [Bacteroidales bacterium]|nr:T9SS type A sorting domain-containing protein [Bacteroidales bacterium]